MTYLVAESTDFDECLDMTLRMMQAANDLHYATNYPGFEPVTFGTDKARVYTRVWVQQWSKAAWCTDCKVASSAALKVTPFVPVICDHPKPIVEGQRFVCFFVQNDNGDVWKGSWKAPVKNFTRGNIMTREGRVALLGDRSAQNNFYFYAGK